jgi:hypothetical protein
VNPHESTEKMKLLLNCSHIEPQTVRPKRPRGFQRNTKPPSWCVKYQSGFTTLPPVLLQEHLTVVLLLEIALISWSLGIDECGGHKDLCGSDRRSVISYVHRKTGLYCSSLPCLCGPEPFSSDPPDACPILLLLKVGQLH